jgi:hypothetical protein
MKTRIAITATTKNIPTPTPALNMPSTTEQLENDNSKIKRTNIREICFCMITKLRLECKIRSSLRSSCYTIIH